MNCNHSTIEKQYFSKSCNPIAEGQLNASCNKDQKRHFLLCVMERNGVSVNEKVHFVQHFTLNGSFVGCKLVISNNNLDCCILKSKHCLSIFDQRYSRGGVESNRTNFKLIFIKFFEYFLPFRIYKITNF